MRNLFIWRLRFFVLGLIFIGCRPAMSSEVLLNEIMEFSKKEFLENESGPFQIPVILSQREHDELAKKNPDVLSKVLDLSRSEGKQLLVEQVKLRRLDRDLTELFEGQLTDPDFRQVVETKGLNGVRFSEEAIAGIRFLILSLNHVWSEEEGVRAELRSRVAKALRQQNHELADIRPKR
jgi:hypothetical protein